MATTPDLAHTDHGRPVDPGGAAGVDHIGTRAGRVAGAVAAAVSLAVAGFEAALAFGAPWGAAAWGGQQAELGPALRAASGVAAVVWVGVAAIALRQGGRDTWAPVSDRWLRPVTTGVAVYASVGVVLNLASRSAVERAVWTPATLVLAAGLGLAVAWGRRAR